MLISAPSFPVIASFAATAAYRRDTFFCPMAGLLISPTAPATSFRDASCLILLFFLVPLFPSGTELARSPLFFFFVPSLFSK